MVTERVEVDIEELYDEQPQGEVMDDATIQQTIAEEQATNDTEKAEEGEDAQDAPRHDAFKEAAESLTREPEPEVVTKADLEGMLGNFANTFKAEIAELKAAGAQIATENPTPDEIAFTKWLHDASEDPTPEQIAQSRAEFRAFKQQAEQEQEEQSIPDRLKAIEEGIQAIKTGAAQPPRVQQWTDAQRQHLSNAVMYLSAGAGLNVDLSNATQVSAVMDGITPGTDVPTAIQQMQGNIQRIKSFTNNEQTTNEDATNTVAAQVANMGGAATTSDNRVFNTVDDLKLAIANDEIALEDYNKYLAQIEG